MVGQGATWGGGARQTKRESEGLWTTVDIEDMKVRFVILCSEHMSRILTMLHRVRCHKVWAL